MAMSTMLHEEHFPKKAQPEVNAFNEPLGKQERLLREIAPTDREGDWSLLHPSSWFKPKETKPTMSTLEKEAAPLLPIPNFGDLGKSANDLLNKDFYHTAQANLEVKLKAPNGTNVTAKGKQGFDGVTTASVEGKHNVKEQGLTITQVFTTASLLDTKLELADVVAPGVKLDLQNLWNPSKATSAAQKLTFAFKNPSVHSRAFINYAQASGNIDALVDVVAGHDGFLVGGEAGYDVQKAAITKYSLALGYQTPSYVATVQGTQNLSVIAASYYQKINGTTEAGVKVGYDVQAAAASGVELASKYKLDPLSFAKFKINDRGIAALAYSTKLNTGTTLGLGVSLDTAKLNEAGHKIGTSLTFEG